MLGKNLEEGNGVFNVFEVGGDLQPDVEALPLAPGGGIFLEDGCIETLGDCLLFRMVVSCCLNLDGRGVDAKAFYVGSVCGSGK